LVIVALDVVVDPLNQTRVMVVARRLVGEGKWNVDEVILIASEAMSVGWETFDHVHTEESPAANDTMMAHSIAWSPMMAVRSRDAWFPR